jgi:hypothetical protein
MTLGAGAIIFGLARLNAHLTTGAIIQILAGACLLGLSIFWFNKSTKTDREKEVIGVITAVGGHSRTLA